MPDRKSTPKLYVIAILIIMGITLFLCQKNSYAKIAATLIVINTRIWTGNPAQPWAEAVSIHKDKILAIGSNTEIQRQARENTQIIDAHGQFVCPGFTDSHLHFLEGGMRLASVQLRDAKTPEEFTERIKEYIATVPAGTWITGGDWDHTNWGGELPDRQWIDAVSPENPVWVSRLDGHMALANSLALQLAGVTEAVQNVEGGTFVRDTKGRLTGILKDNAMYPVDLVVPEPNDTMKVRALNAAMEYVLSNGVTSIQHMGTWEDLAVFEKARDEHHLKVRVFASVPIRTTQKLHDKIAAEGSGDEWLKIGGLKGFMDGSLGSHTAAMFEAFSDSPSDSGLLMMDEEEMYHLVKTGDSLGCQAVIHAIGDRANHIMLDIFEKVSEENGPRDRRFRIEHAQHLTSADIPRFHKLGVIASMQPYHCIDDGRWAEPLLGKARMKYTHAYRSLLDSGAKVTFGSDWFVAPPTPLEGIYAAVTRATLDGKNPAGWVPEQKISVTDALTGYTSTPAYVSFDESLKGTIEPGKLADLVILDQDITKILPEEIWNTKVVKTIVGGKVAYSK